MHIAIRLIAIIFISCLSANGLVAQQISIKGVILDAANKQTVIGAGIRFLNDSTDKTAVSNLDGEFTINLSVGNYTVTTSAIGYNTKTEVFDFTKPQNIEIALSTKSIMTTEVEIKSTQLDENIKSTDVGHVKLDMQDIKELPALMGEVDVLKSIQLLPGVQSGGEGTTGLFIRGGGPDQNLVLLDEAPIYNTGHLFGFFSVFNADAIDRVELYKGGIPAQYGGRLSSVVDFGMRPGSKEKWSADGGVGIIASRLAIHGPIVKDKATLLLSGRRTYIDIITKPFLQNEETSGIPYFFHDFNGKLSWKVNDNNHIYVSGYTGRDNVSFLLLDNRFKADIRWGNDAATVQWQHTFSDSLFVNVFVHTNGYQFESNSRFDQVQSSAISNVSDYGVKTKFHWLANARHDVVWGAEYGYHVFTPRTFEAKTTDGEGVNLTNTSPNNQKYAQDAAVFLHDEIELTKRLKLNAGLRYSIFQQLGPYTEFQQNNGTIDTTQFNRLERVRHYGGFEPRVFGRYSIDSLSSVKAAVSVNRQYLHLLSLSGNNLPFDVWVPSSALVEPQVGIQYSVGYFRNFLDNKIESSVEVYYRDMFNQLTFREDFVPTLNGELEYDLVAGTGRSYGLELYVKKDVGRLHGWFGYTLSKSERQFDDVNGGQTFPYRYDRRHDLSIAATYKYNDRWTFGSSFVYATGQALTLQVSRYLIEGSVINKYGPRNAFRMPAYHRLDLSATLKNKPRKRINSEWVFSVYNVYNRKNAYIIYIDTEGDPTTGELKVVPRLFYLFPILPSITWNFKF